MWSIPTDEDFHFEAIRAAVGGGFCLFYFLTNWNMDAERHYMRFNRLKYYMMKACEFVVFLSTTVSARYVLVRVVFN
jgi:hypothetical protein